MLTYRLADGELDRITSDFNPTQQDMENLAFFLLQQVEDRFRTQGGSGGKPWPARSPITMAGNKGRAMMTGRSARLRESFVQFVQGGDGSWVVGVESTVPYAHVHQVGTEKYGGPIPTIKPKTAKALFIPITDRAASSDRLEGKPAAALRRVHGGRTSLGPLRAANRGRKSTSKKTRRGVDVNALNASGVALHAAFTALKRGRISTGGELEVWDERLRKYKRGIPDFIFLSQVDVPPRPMLPNGEDEQQAQMDFLASIGAGGEPDVPTA